MEIYVVNLVREFKSHKVIGADIYLGSTRKRVSIKELASLLSNKQYKLSNAVFTKDGILRGKPGVSLPSVALNTTPSTIEQRDIAQAKKIKTVNKLTIYHGSKEKVLVPQFGIGKKNNDYGQGFYTTPNKELAKEWAYAGYTSGAVGYVHTFKDIDIADLNVLDFTEMDSMHWLAELLAYRQINGTSGITAEVLGSRIQAVLDNFKINTKNVDIIIGYRADDSYFTVAEAFVMGTLYKEAMELAFRHEDLGLQVFFKSSRAFKRLRQSQHSIELVDKKYKARFDRRDCMNTFTLIEKSLRLLIEYPCVPSGSCGVNKNTIADIELENIHKRLVAEFNSFSDQMEKWDTRTDKGETVYFHIDSIY